MAFYGQSGAVIQFLPLAAPTRFVKNTLAALPGFFTPLILASAACFFFAHLESIYRFVHATNLRRLPFPLLV